MKVSIVYEKNSLFRQPVRDPLGVRSELYVWAIKKHAWLEPAYATPSNGVSALFNIERLEVSIWNLLKSFHET